MQPEQENLSQDPEQPEIVTQPRADEPNQVESNDQAGVNLPVTDPIQWNAPEYIEHQRSTLWFVGFWSLVLLLMLAAAFLMKSWSFTILVPIMAAALVFYSHRPPRQMSYVLNGKGLYINDVLHPMNEFRSFGILQDDMMPALMLIPVKRFRPGLTIYFPNEVGEVVVDLLGSRIPMQDLRLDAFDRMVRKLRM